MSLILTSPVNHFNDNFTNVYHGVIGNGVTTVVDYLDSSVTKTVKWLIELVNNDTNKINSYEILAVNNFDTDVVFNRYAIVGNKINHNVAASINGTNIELLITNNELVNITYKIARLEIK